MDRVEGCAMSRTPWTGRRSFHLLWMVLLVIGLLLSACGEGAEPAAEDDGTATDDEGEEPADLRDVTFLLPSDNPLQYHPIFVAQEVGYFAEEGLNVTIEDAGGSSAVIQQLIADNADIGLPSPPAFLNAAARDQDVVWVYSMHYTNVFDLVAPADSGITSVTDLEGRNVGVSELAGGEVPFVRAVLGSEGLVEGENVTLVPVGEGGALTYEALDSGQVEAYSSSVYDIAALAAAGLPTVGLLPDEFKFFPANGVVVTADKLENERDMVLGFLRAVTKGTVWSRTNPEAAEQIAVNVAPELYDDEEIVDAFWDATQQLMSVPPDIEDEPIGSHYMPGWQSFHDFISEGTEEEGALPQPVDLDAALDTALLEEANDFDHDEIRNDAEGYTP
jgi:NitT/TauT family transport system substrate-binding protein